MRALAAVLATFLLVGCGASAPPAETPAAGDTPGAGDTPAAGDAPTSDTATSDTPASGDATAFDLPPMAPFDTAVITLVSPDGRRVDMPVYVADDRAAQRQGLMHVTDLPADAGMVFVYDEDRDGGFWMKNTLLPLSIAFFSADGQVRAILDMEPCTQDPCEVYRPGVSYRHALEVHQGHFDDIGVDETWTVELPAGLVD